MAEQYQCGALIVTCADPISLERCPVFGDDFQAFSGFCPVHRNGPAPALPAPDVPPLSPFDTMANFNTAYDFGGRMAEMMSMLMDMAGGMMGSAGQPGHYAPQGQSLAHPLLPAPSPTYSPPSNLPSVQPPHPFAPPLSLGNTGYPVQHLSWVSADGNTPAMFGSTMTSVSLYYSNGN